MYKVLKFGGTSMGSAANMRRVAEIVTAQGATITVLSAMSGTTDALVNISAIAAAGQDVSQTEPVIASLRAKYSTCIGELLGAGTGQALALMEATFAAVAAECRNWRGELSERLVIAQGELLTSAIFAAHMRETGRNAPLLNAPDYVHKDAEGKVDFARLRSSFAALELGEDVFYITQGFICTDSRGLIDNLGRGGSDYSAALMGAAIDAGEVQIWTDIDGMHNNDPRYVENTYPIPLISYDEAGELAYFGAKILHPATMQPCKERSIPVFLKNTMDPGARGTRISESEDTYNSFHAVAAKDGITVIRIYSARMLMAYGFLRKVFEVFEHYRTPIDMITTAEVSVSLTIDSDARLDEITRELASLGRIEVERDNTIVCVVGHLDHGESGLAASVLEGVKNIPIKMISYGASHRSMAMLVDTARKKEFLQQLNDTLFARPCSADR